MYSLPITVFRDYWGSTRLLSTYVGGTVVLALGTAVAGQAGDNQAWQLPLPLSLSKGNVAVLAPGQAAGPVTTGDLGILIAFDPVENSTSEVVVEARSALRPETSALVPPELAGLMSQTQLAPSRGVPATRGMETPVRGAMADSKAGNAADTVAVSSELITKDEVIPAPVEYVESNTLLPGMYRLEQAGESGIRREIVKTVKVGDQEQSEVLYSYEVQAPKKKVVIQNSKPVTGEKFDLTKVQVSRQVTVEATAYTYTGNPTASGLDPRVGLIAVDPRIIPLGTKVYVEGYGYAIAADTGGDIKGNKVDLFFPTLRQCLDWGRRPVKLYVLAVA